MIYRYSHLRPTEVSRIEFLGVTHKGGEQVTNVVYAYLVNLDTRQIYVQGGEHLAVLDAASGERWLSLAESLTASKYLKDVAGLEIHYVGLDAVDKHQTKVFLLSSGYKLLAKLWLGADDGQIYRVQRQNFTYELRDVEVNVGLDEKLFTLDLKDKEVRQISEDEVPIWLAKTRAPKVQEKPKPEPLTIQTAAKAGNIEAVKEFIKTDSQLVNAKAKHDLTPLHFAAMGGHEDIIELLLGHGADPHARDDNQTTPLWFAAAHGRTGVAKLLIASKADVHAKKNHMGFTPLHIAAMNGHRDVVEVLIKNKADVNAPDVIGKTALHYAVAYGHKEVAELLRQHGATEEKGVTHEN